MIKYRLWGDLVSGDFYSEEVACQLAEKYNCDVEVIDEEPSLFDNRLIYTKL